MLRKLLANNRNFKVKNVEQYYGVPSSAARDYNLKNQDLNRKTKISKKLHLYNSLTSDFLTTLDPCVVQHFNAVVA